ncbi:MAG: hypothetical protein WC544_01680 [Patescibacteria group bacterium]
MVTKVELYLCFSEDDFTTVAKKVGLEQSVINAFLATHVLSHWLGFCHENTFTDILRTLNVPRETIKELSDKLGGAREIGRWLGSGPC